jgi:60S ribosome subunit biogenesis protein NIP7
MTMVVHRKPIREEKTQISRALGRWGVFDFFKDKVLLIREENGTSRQVCVVPVEFEQTMAQVPQPYFAGLVIGDLKKQFVPSVAGADLFARDGTINEFYVTVNENAEKLILYGRDVMGDSIVEASEELGENDLIIYLNERREAIGVGRTRFSGKLLLQKGKITISTVADAGYYLREEGS